MFRIMQRDLSLVQRLFLLFLLLQCAIGVSPVCSYNRQCDDGDLNTFDVCYAPFNTCFNIAKQDDTTGTAPIIPITSSELIEFTNKNPLSIDEKRKIISAAALLLGEFNPNYFLQLNFLKVDIVQELNSFAASLSTPALANQTNFEFHQRMIHIFHMMDDYHSIYAPPSPLSIAAAILGFRVQPFFVPGEKDEREQPIARYAIADIVPGFSFRNPGFKLGAEILKWNGEDISTVIDRFGEKGYGSNPAAQRARAVHLLTFRTLSDDAAPESSEVEIEIRSPQGTVFTETVEWLYAIASLEPDSPDEEDTSSRTMTSAIHLSVKRRYLGQSKQRIKRASRTPPPTKRASRTPPPRTSVIHTLVRLPQQNRTTINVIEDFEGDLAAEIVHTQSGPIGRLILPSFATFPSPKFQAELTRILRLMPKNGLVLDARNNLGGSPSSAELVTKLATGTDVESFSNTFRATEFALKLVSLVASVPGVPLNTQPLKPAVETALRAGERFTGPILNWFEEPGNVGVPRVYFGPVVSLVNGRTYSAGDAFASLQVDKNASLLIGTSNNVGGGGAFVTTYDGLVQLAPDLLEPLPGGVSFTTAFTRFYRRGRFAGALVENFGIKPDLRYLLTLNDAVNEDCDLFEFLGKNLKSRAA